jgi:signal transduction histidine kinase
MTPFLRRLIAPAPSGDPGDERVRMAALAAALAKINHDLRNTLSTAVLAADRVAKIEDPVVARILPRLLEGLERATELATATLNMLGKDAPAFDVARFPLRALVDEISGEIGAKLAWVNAVPEDVTLEADRILFGGALLQIGANAAENGATSLRVSATRENARVRITLADDGPGFADGAKDKLFTPVLGAARAGGTGLGLVLVRELVRAHGGEVRLISTGKDGTTILLELPETGRAGAKSRV